LLKVIANKDIKRKAGENSDFCDTKDLSSRWNEKLYINSIELLVIIVLEIRKYMENIYWSFRQKLLLEDIVKGDNCYVYDSKGQRYIDLESGIWSTSIGHSHPRIVKKIQEQSSKLIHTGGCYANPVIDETSEQLLELLDFKKGKCTFLCSGSETVEFGVEVVQAIIDKPLLLTFTNSYFGSYGSASKKSHEEWYCFDWPKHCQNCACSEGCDSKCQHFSNIPFHRIGGFIFEPGSSDFIKLPPKQLVLSITNLIQKNHGFLMSNEITTGFGRTGEWFGYQHYGIKPDIVAIGKGIGSGYPVSALALSERTVNCLKNKEFYYCQSHQNDALGAAVAGEVIQVIKEENLIERGRRIGNNLISSLIELSKGYSIIKEIRGRGLMIAIEFIDNQNNNIAYLMFKELLQRNFIVSYRIGFNYIRLDPSLTINENDIASFLHNLESILKDMD